MTNRPALHRMSLAIAIVVTCLAGLSASYPAWAEGTLVSVTPDTQTVAAGKTANVDIVIDGVENLYAADVRLAFDPNVLQVIDANPRRTGIQVELGPLLTRYAYIAVRAEADNAAGTVWVALSQLNPAPPVTGGGVLAHVSFRAIAPGESAISVTDALLSDRNGIEIPADVAHASIVVMPEYVVRFPIIVR